jgi:type IV pilus assembly protein PilY1
VNDNYWSASASGDCLGFTASDTPDGVVVEKGAQASMLRAILPGNRNVKTCSTPGTFSSCSLANFASGTAAGTAAITQSMLNPTAGATDKDDLINWARGVNLDNELEKGNTAMRPYVHGDVVHSRPVAVNHSAGAVVVYYGANDGMLRAVNGNRGSSTSATEGQITSGGAIYPAGAELWSFMPPEFYGSIKRQRDNTNAVSFPGSTVATAQPKSYGMDGPISALQTNGSAYVYATMRRGGRVVYAFNTTTPGSPEILWKKGCPNATNDTDCSSGFSGMGQTWSTLKTMYASGYESGATPLLIMGGGYDKCEDYDALTAGGANHNCTTSTKGNKVYVLNASTGAVIKVFDTDRSVIADSTIVVDSLGKAAYAYTADMGGNVYRMAFGNTAPASWTITKIASLGCDTTSSCSANRKFGFQPSVVTNDNITYYVMLGSGEREKPVASYTSAKSVANHFFMVMDKPSDSSWLNLSATCASNVICKSTLLNITNIAEPSAADLDGKRGWYMGFLPGEQVVTSAVTIFGMSHFSTHQPTVYTPGMCKPNLGETRLYKRDYKTGKNLNGTTSAFEDVAGDGLPPSPVAGRVQLDNGQTVSFCIGCTKDSPLEGTLPKALGASIQPKNRLYWYLQK